MKGVAGERTVQGLGFDPAPVVQREWLNAAGDVALRHLDAMATATIPQVPTSFEISRLPSIGESPAEGGIGEALKAIVAAANASLNTTSPGYFGFIPGGGLYATAIADFVADVLNRYTGIAALAPPLAQLEANVLSWLAREFGYGPAARGLFTSGGSLATFAAIVRARDARFSSSADLRLATGYVSSEGHGSVASAFKLAGIPPGNLRRIPVDGTFRLRTDQLETAIESDQREGREPFIVIATVGSTNTGAIDPLSAISAICEKQNLWLHADAAYGGAFVLCEEGHRLLAGIERANSITFDPHKGLFLPYGTGCLLLRDGFDARSAQWSKEVYLHDVYSHTETQLPVDPSAFGLELTRPYRGLRVWLPLILHGAGAFRNALEEKLALTRDLYESLKDFANGGLPIEIAAAPQLSIIAFRLKRDEHESLVGWNQRNLTFLQRINGQQRSYLSSTTLPAADGTAVTLRVCVLSHRTSDEHIRNCLEDIRVAALTV